MIRAERTAVVILQVLRVATDERIWLPVPSGLDRLIGLHIDHVRSVTDELVRRGLAGVTERKSRTEARLYWITTQGRARLAMLARQSDTGETDALPVGQEARDLVDRTIRRRILALGKVAA